MKEFIAKVEIYNGMSKVTDDGDRGGGGGGVVNIQTEIIVVKAKTATEVMRKIKGMFSCYVSVKDLTKV